MNNLEAKQEAIKNAYGECWENVKDYVDENGWASYPNVQKHDYDFGKLEFKDGCTFLRPESLKGIENNNGWIKIESEKDLPKVSGLYFGKDYEFGTDMMYFDFETKKWEDSNGYLQNVTHYQPIEKPKPPIY